MVRHTGSEPPLFKPGIPVVCEGHWDAGKPVFDSDRILVKHTESYKKANPGSRGVRQAVNAALGTGGGGPRPGRPPSCGIVTLGTGLVRKRPALLQMGATYAVLVLVAALRGVRRHGARR